MNYFSYRSLYFCFSWSLQVSTGQNYVLRPPSLFDKKDWEEFTETLEQEDGGRRPPT